MIMNEMVIIVQNKFIVLVGVPGEGSGAEQPVCHGVRLAGVALLSRFNPKTAIARTPWPGDHLETLFGKRSLRPIII